MTDSSRRFASAALWLAGVATAAYFAWLLQRPASSSLAMLVAEGVAVGALWSRTLASQYRPSNSYSRFVADTWDVHVLGLVLLLGLVYQQVATEGITSDGCLYFAHLRSLVFDRDFEIGPELAMLRLPPRPHHIVSIGAAIVWAPIYLLVWAVDGIGQAIGIWSAPVRILPGLTGAYARAALISSYLVTAAGLLALHLRLRHEFDRMTMVCASLLAFGATPIAWYAIYEPSMTHAASFGLTSLLLAASAVWIPAGPLSLKRGLTLGALLGMIVAIRPQDALFGIFPFILACHAEGWRVDRARGLIRTMLLIALGASPFVILELAFVTVLMAAQPMNLIGQGGYLHLMDSRWMDVLFSSWHGFFSWTPIAYVAFIGTFFYVRRNRPWAVAALVVFAAMCWVNGSADDWWGGWAFGGRRFASTVAALLPGLAIVIAGIRRRPLVLVIPVTITAIAWNAALMSQYHHGRLPRDAPISFTTMMRQQADVLTDPPRFYPFAFPANAWFAWREGLPIDRYDLLAPVPLHPRIDLTLDREAEPFLLDGWEWIDPEPVEGSSPERVEAWLVAGPEASLVLPLDPPVAPPIALEIDARTVSSGEPMHAVVDVQVNAAPIGRATIGPERRTIRFDTGTIGSNRRVWRKGYNRLTFRVVGVWPAASSSESAAQPAERSRDRTRIAVQAIRAVPRPFGRSF